MRSIIGIAAGIGFGLGIALVPGLGLVVIVLLAPAAVGALLDRDPGRPLLRAMMLPACAAALLPVWQTWRLGAGFGAGMSILSDPATIGWPWVAAAGGWLAAQAGESLAVLLMGLRAARRKSALEARLAELDAEWGDPDRRDTGASA